MSKKLERRISRRESLKVCLVPAGAALATHFLIGCGGDDNGSLGQPSTPQPGAGGDGSSAVGTPASGPAGSPAPVSRGGSAGSSTPVGSAGSAGSGASPAAASGGTGAPAANGGSAALAGSGGQGSIIQAGSGGGIAMAPVAWATGGTKAMMGGYPDPFQANPPGMACMVYPSQTLGPCYAMGPMMREDISDGMDGLPMRVSLLVVSSNGCRPIPGAIVDIWHSGSTGAYSAYATGTTCNPGTVDTTGEMFGRGIQMTNEMGRADFSTIFPGWYRGRAIHLHFTVRVNGRDSKTSQLYFEDKLIDEIHMQGVYKARGKRDTPNSTDNTFKSGNATPEQVIMAAAQRQDGALHAWKVISVMM
jgi:protocatechuate 3,4-dioxygenase beta subunit